MELAEFRFVRISAITPADKSALRIDKSPTRQSRYGDGALQGNQAKTIKKT